LLQVGAVHRLAQERHHGQAKFDQVGSGAFAFGEVGVTERRDEGRDLFGLVRRQCPFLERGQKGGTVGIAPPGGPGISPDAARSASDTRPSVDVLDRAG
jgi:hypothetical protein